MRKVEKGEGEWDLHNGAKFPSFLPWPRESAPRIGVKHSSSQNEQSLKKISRDSGIMALFTTILPIILEEN